MPNIKQQDSNEKNEKAKLVLVDDEELILSSLKMILERYFTVFATQDPTEVLSIIKNNDIDILVSDEMMPLMRGCELAEKIHNEYPDICKIILSGNSDKKDIVRAVNNGHIYSFLFKPVDVTAGIYSDGRVEILSGLKKGSRVVTSGQFLIDSEANLQASFNRLQSN